MTSLTKIILSPCLLTPTTPFLRLLSIKTPTPFLFATVPVYQSLKPVLSTSFAFWPFHLVSWTHNIFTRLLVVVSTNSLNLPVSDPTFQLPKRILVGSTSFLTLHTRRLRCEDPCSFFTTPGHWCSAPLRKRWPDPCSLDTMPRSRHGASPRGCRPGPYPFNTIPRYRYGSSLRGLRPNGFLLGFISIRMARFNVGSPRLSQPSSFTRAWDLLC